MWRHFASLIDRCIYYKSRCSQVTGVIPCFPLLYYLSQRLHGRRWFPAFAHICIWNIWCNDTSWSALLRRASLVRRNSRVSVAEAIISRNGPHECRQFRSNTVSGQWVHGRGKVLVAGEQFLERINCGRLPQLSRLCSNFCLRFPCSVWSEKTWAVKN